VFADAAATAVFAPQPLPSVLADASASTLCTVGPDPLVLAHFAAAAVFAPAPLPLVLADVLSEKM